MDVLLIISFAESGTVMVVIILENQDVAGWLYRVWILFVDYWLYFYGSGVNDGYKIAHSSGASYRGDTDSVALVFWCFFVLKRSCIGYGDYDNYIF